MIASRAAGAAALALAACALTGSAEARPVLAPYADVTLSQPFPLLATAHKLGVSDITMGFVEQAANGAPCSATWGGEVPVTAGYLRDDVTALRTNAGNVVPSFGGAGGTPKAGGGSTDLAESCRDATSLADQYQAVLDAYSPTRLDFDIEGGALTDMAGIDRRSAAIALVAQRYAAAHPGGQLQISLTLPAEPTGLDSDALAVVRSALAHGVNPVTVNVMAMDYGPPAPRGRMGNLAIRAAMRTNSQLAPLLHLSTAATWRRLAVTPMLGANDIAGETFTIRDARVLGAFARRTGLGRLGFWSASRDRACSRRRTAGASPSCSGVPERPGQFTRTLRAASA